MYQITQENLLDLRIGDIITKDDATWVVIADPTPRDSSGEMMVETDVYSQTDADNGWCGFTLGTDRYNLNKFFALTQEDEPEYFL